MHCTNSSHETSSDLHAGPTKSCSTTLPAPATSSAPSHPRTQHPDQLALDDSLNGAGEATSDEGGRDATVPASNTLFSSSIGFTFVVDAGVDSIRVQPSWGSYSRVASDLHFTDDGNARMVWKRTPCGGPGFDLPLEVGRHEAITPDTTCGDVKIEAVVRPPQDDGLQIVTLFLVNNQPELDQLKDSAWVFQPEISVTATDGESAVFVRRDRVADLDPDNGDPEAEERAILSMVHRKQAEFGIGHGVAVHAETAGDPWVDDEGWERAVRVGTTVLPWYDVPVTETPDEADFEKRFPGFGGFVLDMGELAEMDRDDVIAALSRIPETYTLWIEEQRARLGIDPDLESHRVAAERALDKAETARDRLAEGVKVLADDEDAFEAFRFANKAMRIQRLRSLYALARRRGAGRDLRRHRSIRNNTLAGIPVGLRAAEHSDRHAGRPSQAGTGSRLLRRPALVPHRRRQDRGLPRSRRVHDRQSVASKATSPGTKATVASA